MPAIIKQIIKQGDYNTQVIRMIVRSNERGPQGEQGDTGPAATIQAGEVYMVPPESDPAVINSGTSSEAVFDFYIPKGTKGDPGKDGTDGKDGAIQYTAGTGIEITADNVIQATGTAVAEWGGITGTLSDQTDLKNALDDKQDKLTAGANISISGGTISATDTTYSDFTGTDGTSAGTNGLVPAPATTDAGKFLNASGAWVDETKPNDATLTIQKNGTDVATFTANASTAATANIEVPVITMTTTDPGEGAALAADNFIAVYSAS